MYCVPCESLVLVQGRRMVEEPSFERIHDLRSGKRLRSTSWLDGGISSPKRIWPHQAVMARAKAHVWRGEPPYQAMTSMRIMAGVIGLRSAFGFMDPGHLDLSALFIKLHWGGISKGASLILCHAAKADRLPCATLSPVLPMPSASQSSSMCGSQGRALCSGTPQLTANLMKRLIA